MNVFDLPEKRSLTFGILTLASLPKRLIDATRDYDPHLEGEEHEFR